MKACELNRSDIQTHQRELPARIQLAPAVCEIAAIDAQGYPLALIDGLTPQRCEVLEGLPALFAGDRVLVARVDGSIAGVVIGRLAVPGAAPRQLILEATDRLALRCGDASLEMHADGKVLLKGDDVVLRAKGTQRIRAGNVAIN